jgi:hypothetical protein
MIYGDPMQKKDVLTVRKVLADHRYRYLQSLVLYNYNKMETRFLVSALFILLSGVMFWAVADDVKAKQLAAGGAGGCAAANLANPAEVQGFTELNLVLCSHCNMVPIAATAPGNMVLPGIAW